MRMFPRLAGVLVLIAVTGGPAAAPQASETLRVGGTGWSLGITRILADSYEENHPEISIDIPPSVGSTGGIRAVLAHDFDLSISARQLDGGEKSKGLNSIPFIKSPFAFFGSSVSGNEVLSLSESEILGIYKGTFEKWPNGLSVRPILRLINETNSRLLMAWFDGIEPFLEKSLKERGALIAYSDQEAMDMAERIPGAIATGTLVAVSSEGRSLQPIAVEGKEPTIENLEKGAYDLSVTLWLIDRNDNREAAKSFRSFMLSPVAEKIMRSHGAILLTRE